MKKTSLWLLSALLIFLISCKQDRPDMSGLLKTVPSSAAGVIGIHLESLAEDAGCKVNDNEIKPGKEVLALMEKMSDNEKGQLLNLLNGGAGIQPDAAVVFFDANRTFLTLSLYDVVKFKDFVKKDKMDDFSDEGSGVQVCNNIAIKGNQAWICLSSTKRIDPDAIAAYASLSESQSFLNTDMSKILLEEDADIVGWSKFNNILSNLMSRSERTKAAMAAGLLFEDVDAVSFEIDFEKGELEFEAEFLNDKGKPAKYLLPAEKINANTIKELGGSCDGLLAFTITPKLVQKINKLGTSLGGNMFGNFEDILKNIDGTVAFAFSGENECANAIIPIKGKMSDELTSWLSFLSQSIEQDGNYLRLSTGTVDGGISVDECADLLKGYCIGMVADLQTLKKQGQYFGISAPSSLSSVTLGFQPSSGSLKFSMEMKSVDKNENFLLSILKSL